MINADMITKFMKTKIIEFNKHKLVKMYKLIDKKKLCSVMYVCLIDFNSMSTHLGLFYA